jgi:hypothetical protein
MNGIAVNPGLTAKTPEEEEEMGVRLERRMAP